MNTSRAPSTIIRSLAENRIPFSRTRLAIIEGPRCSGKTTMCRELERMGIEYLKFERGEDPISDMAEQITSIFSNGVGRRIVLDRFHLSEWVLRHAEFDYNSDDNFLVYSAINRADMIIAIHNALVHFGCGIFQLWAPLSIRRERMRFEGRKPDMDPEIEGKLWMSTALLQNIVYMSSRDEEYTRAGAELIFKFLNQDNSPRRPYLFREDGNE